ncbi:ShKT domain-containing protein [Aphelenchoides besseyi]|nr:ShKT domain-containing protein [Aphelenchoides besseyi]
MTSRLMIVMVCGLLARSSDTSTAPRQRERKPSTIPRFSVLRAVPSNQVQVNVLEELEHNSSHINFWTSPRLNSAVDMMVEATEIAALKSQLRNISGVDSAVIIEDVEKLIIAREQKPTKNADFNRRFRDDTENEGESAPRYDFNRYGSYMEMTTWMRALARRYPSILQFISIGKTHENRSIEGLEIGTKSRNKRVFWIDAGKWLLGFVSLLLVYRNSRSVSVKLLIESKRFRFYGVGSSTCCSLLTSKYGRDPNITNYVDQLTFVVIPNLNPDGYEFSRSSTNPNVRLWRKSRSPSRCVLDQWNRQRCCRGVDLNRNFDFHFRESGSSDDPCSEIYQGSGPFSEPETQAVRDAVLSSRYRGRIDGFVTLHTYSQIWIHPYGHKKDSYPGDVQELYNVGKKATNALSKLYGTKYVVGSGADTLYPASGGSEDWAKQTVSIKYVYLLELRPDEKNFDGFILDEDQLIPTAQETWVGIKVVADAIIQRSQNRMVPPPAARRMTDGNTALKQYRFGDGTPGSCYDIRHACKRWIQENESLCKTVPVFMREQCAYSCGYC